MVKPSARLRLVICRRVSTAGQATDGYGLEAQEHDCRRWNKSSPAGGHRIVHVVTDEALTGKSTIDEREGLMEAMEWIREGRADGILAPNLDRLARELTVQEAVLSYVWAMGGRVFTADHGEHLEDDETDPMRTAMRQMRGVFHQLDRGLIRKRLREGRETKGELGGYAYGAPRYGHRAEDNELIKDEAEARNLALMRRWHDEEGLGVRAIARRANEMGIPAKRGGQWHPSTVARLLDEEERRKNNEGSARRRAWKKEEQRKARAERILNGH
ncbi:recombinase family protein [Streptomyces himalayensis]|uniref:Recombinase family protein n=1 Tax=Streptomyces himalayensis subsp. himalayensis TaxID=2756131 RepID=A0A7W0IDM6_9ACTN|nr:recombinase family protein [Streptomyces himalayensis]MBA2951980.1 recombinase family protein [Streptomyces himalayensis subsp. himalayensis]